jgi:Holliday junction resolvasome RuvABC DNA-binding subunit
MCTFLGGERMKKEIAFFRDKRYKPSAQNLIDTLLALGYSNKQIIEEIKKAKAIKEAQDQQKGVKDEPTA